MSGAGGLRKHGHASAGDGGTISVLTNPMTTPADLIVGGTAGAPARLAKGSDGQVLTVDPTTHLLVWATNPAGFSDPMTTRGDMIYRNSSNATARLAVGASARYLGSDGTDLAYRQVGHGDLSGVTANQHHTQSHDHASSGDGTSLSPATLVIPGATSPAQTAEGSAVWDTDDDKLTIGTGAARKTLMNVGDDPTAHAASHKSGGSDSIKLNEFANPTANVNLNSNRITSLADPSASQDAATKNYVDGVSGAGITVEEEDAAPSVSNVVTIKVTNGKLIDNGSGSVSLDLGGSGGAWPPLDQYTIDGTYGDHFDGASLSGLWTRRNYTGGGETYQLGYNATYMRISQSGRAAGDAYLQSSSADGTYACKIIYRNFGNNYPAFGLCMVDSSGTGVWVASYNNPAGFLLGSVTTYSSYGGTFHMTGGGGDVNPVIGGMPGNIQEIPVWLYLRKSGSSVYAAHSLDGEIWSAESSALTWAGTMNRVGFLIGPLGSVDGSADTAFINLDWFNKI